MEQQLEVRLPDGACQNVYRGRGVCPDTCLSVPIRKESNQHK